MQGFGGEEQMGSGRQGDGGVSSHPHHESAGRMDTILVTAQQPPLPPSVRTVHRGRAELLSEEGRRNGDNNNRSGGGDPLCSVYADALELHGSNGGRTEVGGK